MTQLRTRNAFLGLLFALLIPGVLALTTLQTIPNGSSHYYMIDVGETQIVLNQWGTLHPTSYPHYVITGNVLTNLLTGIGISAATAPGVISLLWGLAALSLIYMLAVHLSGDVLLSAGTTILFGLTRTVWIHNSIAEIYSFGLLILVGLLALALWKTEVRGRLYWLALLGGIGVAHHRAIVMVIPALLFATWDIWKKYFIPHEGGSETRPYRLTSSGITGLVKTIVICVLLGALGFLPYLYLPLRDQAGAAWVYGSPGKSVQDFLDQFLGREANRFIGMPETQQGLLNNLEMVTEVLARDLTIPGVVLGIIGLLLGLQMPRHRKAAFTFILSGAAAFIFHVLLYTDVLSALILPITLSLAFGWLYGAVWILQTVAQYSAGLRPAPTNPLSAYMLVLIPAFILGAFLIYQNYPFIKDLTTDRTGLETIAQAEAAPPNSTMMIAWGPRHFAVGFARDVEGRLQDIKLVDHNADFAEILAAGETLITPDYTIYNQPPGWWEARLGTSIYPHAVAPHWVEIKTEPTLAEVPDGEGSVRVANENLTCDDRWAQLEITWFAVSHPEREYSVFVHLVDANGAVIAQDDRAVPAYGWRPLTTWQAGEAIRDFYVLPRMAGESSIRYGLYYQADSGEFINEYVFEHPVCEGQP